VLEGGITASMMAIVILSMALTPLAVILLEELLPAEKQSMDGIESAGDLHGRVLDVGSGRFAQFVSQPLLTKGIDVSLIEVDVQIIRALGQFGFMV
jgi:glutathione-regulated potassium-efflux system protein KefB